MDDAERSRARVVEQVAPLAERFRSAGYRTYLVGGIVRDLLLGHSRRAPDIDLTTDAPPAAIKDLLSDVVDALWTQGERFGTIGCRWRGEMIEITTHRAEAYEPRSRKPEVQFSSEVRDDLSRRDFTVNAMAISLDDGELVDPFDGQGDLVRRVLRTPLSAEASFTDDPLRMLRAARFVAGYDLAPVGPLEDAIVALRHRMAIVSRERVRDEIEKLLAVADPTAGLDLLARTGLLGEVLPDVAALVERGDPLAGDDLLRHTLAVVVAATSRRARWAAIVHHLGGDVGEATLRALTLSLDDVRAVSRCVRLHGIVDGENTTGERHGVAGHESALFDVHLSDADARRLAHAAGALLGEVLELAIANAATFVGASGDAARERTRLAQQRLQRLQALGELDGLRPLLDGAAVQRVLGVAPGPVVGKALRFLLDLRLERGRVEATEAERALRTWWSAQD